MRNSNGNKPPQVKKAEAAVEAIIIRRILERKVQGFTHPFAEECVAATVEALDWHAGDDATPSINETLGNEP